MAFRHCGHRRRRGARPGHHRPERAHRLDAAAGREQSRAIQGSRPAVRKRPQLQCGSGRPERRRRIGHRAARRRGRRGSPDPLPGSLEARRIPAGRDAGHARPRLTHDSRRPQPGRTPGPGRAGPDSGRRRQSSDHRPGLLAAAAEWRPGLHGDAGIADWVECRAHGRRRLRRRRRAGPAGLPDALQQQLQGHLDGAAADRGAGHLHGQGRHAARRRARAGRRGLRRPQS